MRIRFLKLFVRGVFTISLFSSISCALPEQSKHIIPYVFEGVVQPGVENAPPVQVTLDTEFPDMPETVPVFRVETVDEAYINNLANRLGFSGEPGHSSLKGNPYFYTRDTVAGKLIGNAMELDVYPDGRFRMFGYRSIKDVPKSLPTFEEAVNIAREWLISHDVYPANITDVQKGGGLTVTNSQTGETTAYDVTVKFMARLGDIDRYSPGATVKVGENGKILEASVKGSQLKDYGMVALKMPQSALKILEAYLTSPLAKPPEANECVVNLRSFESLTVTRISLQYTESNSYLLPIYVFEGNASIKGSWDTEHFIGKIDAVSR